MPQLTLSSRLQLQQLQPYQNHLFSECIFKPKFWAFSVISNLIRSVGHIRNEEERIVSSCTSRSSCNFITLKQKGLVIFISSKLKLFTKVPSLGSEKKHKKYFRYFQLMETWHENSISSQLSRWFYIFPNV